MFYEVCYRIYEYIYRIDKLLAFSPDSRIRTNVGRRSDGIYPYWIIATIEWVHSDIRIRKELDSGKCRCGCPQCFLHRPKKMVRNGR